MNQGENNEINKQQLAILEAKQELALQKQQFEFELKLQKLEAKLEIDLLNLKLANAAKDSQTQKAHFEEKLELTKKITALESQPKVSNSTSYLASMFQESIILNPGQKSIISSWLGSGNWTKIYSTDCGATPAVFHNHCNGRGPTITFVRYSTFVFGAYASVPWTSSGGYKSAPGSFLFTLNNSYGNAPTILPLISQNNTNAMYDHPNHFPIFGNGHDFYIQQNLSFYCNLTGSFSYSNSLGRSFCTFTGAKSVTGVYFEVFSQN